MSYGLVIGAVLAVAFMALGLGTNWWGIPLPWSAVFGGAIGFLCTAVIGPLIAKALDL